MATRELVINKAMQVIGTVESSLTWDSATYFDGVSSIITIGLMQSAGSNARNLLNYCKTMTPTEWVTFSAAAPALANDVDTAPQTWDWWSGRYLTREEGTAVKALLGSEMGILAQSLYWQEVGGGYIDVAITRGMSLDNPKPLIYYMCMYHQSPGSANSVLTAAGGSANLDRIHTTRANNQTLAPYTNRYNTCYQMLNEWDGVSEPPDFGQVEGGDNVNGDNPIQSGGGGEVSETNSPITHLYITAGRIIAYGKGEYESGVSFLQTPNPNVYKVSKRTAGSPIEGEVEEGGGSTENPNAEVIEWARPYLRQWSYIYGGDRYNPQNTGGTDCGGLVCAAYWHVRGLELGWAGNWVNSGLMTTIADVTGSAYDSLPWDKMLAGDIVLVSRDDYNIASGAGSHVGMYTGEPGMWIDAGYSPCPNEQAISNYGHTERIVVRRVN